MPPVHFRLEHTIRELTIPAGSELTFDYGGRHHLSVTLRGPSSDEVGIGHKEINAMCTASATADPPDGASIVIDQIARSEIPTAIRGTRATLEYSGPTGIRICLPALSAFPASFRDFFNLVADELKDAAGRTVSVIRWRVGIGGPHNPTSSRGMRWSLDRAFWHPAPADLAAHLSAIGVTLRASEAVHSDVLKLVGFGAAGPAHHDLFREAWGQRTVNPRSALIVGIAAAEIAVKNCIASLLPGSEWLALHMPSPPLERILTEYLPTLPAKCRIKGDVRVPPPALLANIKKGVSMRNGLAHRGAAAPSLGTTEDVLHAVRDLLWLTDYYCGAEWALDYLRAETRATLLEG